MKIPISKTKLIEKIMKFPKEIIFNCQLEQGVCVNGDTGYIETYFADGIPFCEIHVANNHSFSKGYLYV